MDPVHAAAELAVQIGGVRGHVAAAAHVFDVEPDVVRGALLAGPGLWRLSVAFDADTPVADLDVLAGDDDWQVRFVVSINPALSEAAARRLAGDPHPSVAAGGGAAVDVADFEQRLWERRRRLFGDAPAVR
jgi:hypothetical protein